MLVAFLVAGGGWFLNNWLVTYLFGVVGMLLLGLLIFDLATVKLHLHPAERLPERMDELDLFDLMRARRSCRSFQIRKLTPADHAALMASVQYHGQAPTIGCAPIRFEYVAAPLTVWPVVNASEFLVAIVPSEYNRLAVIDVGRTLQKIVTDATRMGVATCWIGPGADPSSVARHLGERFDAEKNHIICVCAVGYKSWYLPAMLRIMNRQLFRRLPLAELFFADARFEEPLAVEAPPFNRFGRTYEICEWSPSSFNGQTTRCAAAILPTTGPDQRLTRFDFFAATDSRYYAPVALGIWCANWEMGCEELGISGHFELLPVEARGDQGREVRSPLPRYDVSWVLDDPMPIP